MTLVLLDPFDKRDHFIGGGLFCFLYGRVGMYVLRFGTGVGCEDVKQFAEKFYKGKKWQRIRALVWARDKGLCQRCLKDGIIRAGDTVHHIVEITPDNINDESISLNPDNLMTVCRDCHAAIHKNSLDRRYTIDEMGRVKCV